MLRAFGAVLGRLYKFERTDTVNSTPHTAGLNDVHVIQYSGSVRSFPVTSLLITECHGMRIFSNHATFHINQV